MVLKDFLCCECGAVVEMMADGERVCLSAICPDCANYAIFKSICNGGTKKRWRFNDWDGVDFSGCVRVRPGGAGRYVESDGSHPMADFGDGEVPPVRKETDSKMVAIRDRLGSRISDRKKFQQEALDEKVERVRHKKEVMKDKRPIYFDGMKNGIYKQY